MNSPHRFRSSRARAPAACRPTATTESRGAVRSRGRGEAAVEKVGQEEEEEEEEEEEVEEVEEVEEEAEDAAGGGAGPR